MKYLILSDIHGNMEALKSVLLEVEAESIKIDKTIILGDLIGYGASPNEVVERVREIEPEAAVRGNHDKVACGVSDGRNFNYAAREAAFWTRKQLSFENTEYVAKLSKGPVEVEESIQIVHGSPWDEDYYILEWREALAAFQRSESNLILFGHTHVPVIWSLNDDELNGDGILDEEYEHPLQEGTRYLVNPGSVGQPRDGNPKASFAVLDTDDMKMRFFRVKYSVKNAQKKILDAGLSSYLADRLAIGM